MIILESYHKEVLKMERRNLRFGVFLLALTWATLSLSGTICYGQKKMLVGIASPSLGDEAQVVIQQGAINACKEYGFNYITTNADRDALTQMNQIDQLISRGVNAVITVPVDAAALSESVKKLNKLGIPVICQDRSSTSGKLVITVQADNYLAGEQAAKFMVGLLELKYGEPKGLVLELQGALGTNVAQLRGGGFNDVMKKYPQIKVISKPTEWLPETGAKVTEDVLTVHPELDGIYCHSDFTLTGVIAALERMGRLELVGKENHIYTVSIDATSQALDWIRQREHDVSVSQPFIAYGTLAVEFFAEYYLKDKKIPVGQTVTRSGVLWSPAQVIESPTGPMINLRTTSVDIHNVDDPRLWANYYGYLQGKK